MYTRSCSNATQSQQQLNCAMQRRPNTIHLAAHLADKTDRADKVTEQSEPGFSLQLYLGLSDSNIFQVCKIALWFFARTGLAVAMETRVFSLIRIEEFPWFSFRAKVEQGTDFFYFSSLQIEGDNS